MFFIKADTPYWQLIIPLIIMGFGFGIASPARTTVVLTTPPPGLTGMAAGVNTAAGQSGYAIGTVLSSILVTQFADRAFIQQLEQNDVPEQIIIAVNNAFQDVFSRAIAGNMTNLPKDLAAQIAVGFGDAFASGLATTFVIVAVVLALSAVAVYLGMHTGLKASFISQPLSAQSNLVAAQKTDVAPEKQP
jgi:hypothetical protein